MDSTMIVWFILFILIILAALIAVIVMALAIVDNSFKSNKVKFIAMGVFMLMIQAAAILLVNFALSIMG